MKTTRIGPFRARRSFLKAAGLTGAAVLSGGLSVAAWPKDRKRVPGIQLYMVKDALEKDPSGTLQRLRSYGYREVETAGFGNLSAGEFRKLVSDAGLTCPSAHLFFGFEESGKLLDDAKALGAEYVVSSILLSNPPSLLSGNFPEILKAINALTLDDFKKIASLANQIGRQAKQAGLQYVYHNHNFEFRDHNGQTGYSILLAETDPELVKFEADCGWMAAAGVDPVDYLQRYSHRIQMIHVKDFLAGTAPSTVLADPAGPKSTELGRGRIDCRAILAAASSAGVKHYFVEQEPPFTEMSALEAAKVDCAYIRSIFG